MRGKLIIENLLKECEHVCFDNDRLRANGPISLMGAVLGIALLLWIQVFALIAAPPWFDRSLVGMEVGPTGAQFGHSDEKDERYASQFNGRDIVRLCREAHSEYVVLWVRDGDYAYYNSKILPKAPGLKDRDPLQEALDEARPHHLPIIAYCVVQQGGHFLKAHPEFEMRGADGKPIGRFCLNSGYLDAMKPILAEQLAYGLDGFHIDMLDQGFGAPYGCWCETCQKKFEKEFGRPMPKGVTWDEDWDLMLTFRYRSSERFEKELAAHIRSLNPQATVDFNYHGNPPFSFEVGQRPVQHATNGDFITGETGVWGFSALTVGLNAEFYRAAASGQRVQVAMQRGVRMYHDQTTRPLNDIRWELLTLLSHGAFVTMVDKTGFDGTLDPVAYDRTGAAFEEVQTKRALFGQLPVQDVGLYFSSRSRDFVAREKPTDYFAGFQGAHKSMVYEHLPWGVILDENVSLDRLKRFPVVILPNAGIVSDGEVKTLGSYVESGGNLIVTGLSGCYDRLGRLQEKTSLEPLIGARLVRKLDSLDNWVRFPQRSEKSDDKIPAKIRPLVDAFKPDWSFLVKGPAAQFEPTTAIPVGELQKPYRTTRQKEGREGTDWPMSAESTVGPAILLNQVGKGTVLTFTCSPDYAVASEHHVVEARKLLAHAVGVLYPKPRIRMAAPTTVETVITEDSSTKTLRVHLLGYNSPPQTTPLKDRPYVLPATIEDKPMYRVKLDLDRPARRITPYNKSTILKTSGTQVEATIDDIHEVITIEYE